MKIVGVIEVQNRSVASLGMPHARARRSMLTIGKESGPNGELFLYLQTLESKLGTKYKVQHNINAIFTRFAHEGKATIRFNEPPHDLLISTSVDGLQEFLKQLKKNMEGETSTSRLLTSAQISSGSGVPRKPITLMKILSKADYPLLKGFPTTLQFLQVNGVRLKAFDQRWFSLEKLTTLDLACNCLTVVPEEINLLCCLHTLNVARNYLGKCHILDWRWMLGKNLKKSLRNLDLSGNKLHFIPSHVTKFEGLIYLNLHQNMLWKLPSGIGRLTNLRFLNLAFNYLESLPCSARMLRLDTLDISGNPFSFTPVQPGPPHLTVPSLLEKAARCVLNSRVPYSSECIPSQLVWYLNVAQYCMCGSSCFEAYSRGYTSFDVNIIASTITRLAITSYSVPLETIICSGKCWETYKSKLHWM